MMPGKMYQCRSWKLLIIATSNWSDTDMIFEHVVGFRPGAIRSANERPLSWLWHWLSHNNWNQLLNQVVLRWQIFVGKWHKSCYMSRIYGERQPCILVKVMYLYRSHMQKKGGSTVCLTSPSLCLVMCSSTPGIAVTFRDDKLSLMTYIYEGTGTQNFINIEEQDISHWTGCRNFCHIFHAS